MNWGRQFFAAPKRTPARKSSVLRKAHLIMAQPVQFRNTLNLIKTLNSLPSTGCSVQCGYTAEDIHAAYTPLFPNNPLTLTDVVALLQFHAGKGVFRKTAFANDSEGAFFYAINTEMNQINTVNQAFVNAGLVVNTSQPGPGYLPEGYNEGFQRDPYGVAAGVGPFPVSNAVNGGVSGNVGSDWC